MLLSMQIRTYSLDTRSGAINTKKNSDPLTFCVLDSNCRMPLCYIELHANASLESRFIWTKKTSLRLLKCCLLVITKLLLL